MKTDRELYDEALAIIDDNLQVVEGIIGNRFATASLIVEFAKRQVNNLDIPVVSVPQGTLPTIRKPKFKDWLEPFKDGEFGNYHYKGAWYNEQAMQNLYNDL